MIPASFDYHAPDTLDDAIGLLAELGEDAKVLSGGMSLLPLLKLRLGEASDLIDIGRIPDLAYVREADGFVEIGGATTETALEEAGLVRDRLPILHDTAIVIADPLVRNRATVGGNLAHGDPANDHPATMLAVRAEVEATGPDGTRTIAIDDFFRGLFWTALEPGEILTAIRIPAPPPRSGGAYLKMERKVGDYATAAVAAQLTVAEDGTVERAGIALTNAGSTPVRAEEAEGLLVGETPDEATIDEAARKAAGAGSPSADWRGSVEYKRNVARVLAGRAIRRAIERAERS